MDTEAATNPETGVDAAEAASIETADDASLGENPSETTGDDTPTEDASPQFDDEGNPIEDQAEPAEDEEEIDIDGFKVKVPKSKAEKLAAERLMQADYTRKTQALAERERAIEAERTAFQQASAEEMSARANLTLIDQQIAQFQKVDWNAYNDQDPFEANKAFQQFTLLKDARAQTANYLSHVQQERTVNEQREAAKRLEEGAAELKRDIKDWSPATAAKLMDFAQTKYSFSKEDLDGIDDPRLIKVLHAAHQWEEHQAKARKAAQIAKGQQVQPVSTLKGTTARTPVRADTNDFSAFEKYAASKLKA